MRFLIPFCWGFGATNHGFSPSAGVFRQAAKAIIYEPLALFAKLRRHRRKDTRPNLTTQRTPFREIGLIGFGVLALYLLIAVFSHSPQDPSFSFSGDAGEVQNWAGSSGAHVSDIFLYLFGFVAYLVPLAVLLLGVRLIYRASGRPAWRTASVRGLGWTLVTLCACLLIQTHVPASEGLPQGAGGILGQALNDAGLRFLGVAGLTLLGFAGVLAGAQAALGFSWLDVAEWVGRAINQLLAALVGAVARRLERARERRLARVAARQAVVERSEKRAEEIKRRKAQKPPRIEPRPDPAPPPKVNQGEMFEKAGLGPVPDMDLLDDKRADERKGYSDESLEAMSRQLELKLKEFGVEVEVVSVLPGPVVTRFEVQPAPGVKAQKIASLAKDLARTLAVNSVRVVEVIPGKSVVGIEIPNADREMVRLKEIFASPEYEKSKSPLSLALGKDVAGTPVVTDIGRMPHLLVAGTTGSGKSVGVNAMLLSILYKASPEQVRLILVDPKMLELSVYEGIPHLLAPVVTDVTQAGHALNWCVGEMERRYRLMAALGVRNLAGYNRHVQDAEKQGEPHSGPAGGSERRGCAAAGAAALHRGGDRRVRRHDDGGWQAGGAADRPHRAKGAGGRPSIWCWPRKGRRSTSSPASSRPTFRPASAFRCRPRWIPAPFWTKAGRSNCSATATCSSCRLAPVCLRGCMAPSSPMRRCIGWSRIGNSAPSLPTWTMC